MSIPRKLSAVQMYSPVSSMLTWRILRVPLQSISILSLDVRTERSFAQMIFGMGTPRTGQMMVSGVPRRREMSLPIVILIGVRPVKDSNWPNEE